MKKLLFYLVLGSFMTLFFSCNDSYNQDVESGFYTHSDTYNEGEEVQFYNTSEDAVSFFWDFGDGGTSTKINPSHIYTKAGAYEVKLVAYGRDNKDETYSMLNITTSYKPTKLNVLVLYFGTDDVAKKCAVDLYESQTNWANFENPVFKGETGTNGEVEFTDVKDIVYYIDAFRYVSDTSYYSNEKIGVATNQLELGITNYYDVYIQYIIKPAAKRPETIVRIVQSSPEIRAKYRKNK